MSDNDFSLKEYMNKLEEKVDKGFDRISVDMKSMADSIEKMKETMENTYAKKSSLDKLWIALLGALAFVAAYFGKILLDLLTHRP